MQRLAPERCAPQARERLIPMSVKFSSLRSLAFIAATALLGSGSAARADVFDLNYSGTVPIEGAVSGNLVLTATPVPPGPITVFGELVSNVTGTVNGTDTATGPLPPLSHGNDNLIYPEGYVANGGLYLDSQGLAFTDSTNGHIIELWALYGNYYYEDLAVPGASGALTSLTLTSASAPGPLPGAGLASLAFLLVAGAALKARWGLAGR
jgi:hypothetical protein